MNPSLTVANCGSSVSTSTYTSSSLPIFWPAMSTSSLPCQSATLNAASLSSLSTLSPTFRSGACAARLCLPASGRSFGTSGGPALRGGDLRLGHRLRQARNLLLQVGAHTFLLATDPARELLCALIAQRLGKRLDRRVGRNLLGLACILGLGVLQLLLLLAGTAQCVQRTLGEGRCLLRAAENCLGGISDRRRPRCLDRGGHTAKLLDSFLDLSTMALGFRQMLLQALLVRDLCGHRDVCGERRLQTLLE